MQTPRSADNDERNDVCEAPSEPDSVSESTYAEHDLLEPETDYFQNEEDVSRLQMRD